MSKLRRISIEDFEFILELLIEYHRDRSEPIPKNYNREKVESSLSQPFSVIFGMQCYPGFLRKAATLFYLFCKNHCMENGNKRVAIGVLTWFCYINNRDLNLDDDDLHKLSIIVSTSDALEHESCIEMIMAFLTPFIRPLR